jgi:hypothetical protein
MATLPNTTTTLLGKAYAGRPTGLALSMRSLEQSGRSDKAHALLDAHNRINRAFRQPDYDLARDFTDLPMEGGFTIPAVPIVTVAPRSLNARLWELTAKETTRTITRAETAELDAICAQLEGAAA